MPRSSSRQAGAMWLAYPLAVGCRRKQLSRGKFDEVREIPGAMAVRRWLRRPGGAVSRSGSCP